VFSLSRQSFPFHTLLPRSCCCTYVQNNGPITLRFSYLYSHFLWFQLNVAAADLRNENGVQLYRCNDASQSDDSIVVSAGPANLHAIRHIINSEGHCPNHLRDHNIGSNTHLCTLLNRGCTYLEGSTGDVKQDLNHGTRSNIFSLVAQMNADREGCSTLARGFEDRLSVLKPMGAMLPSILGSLDDSECACGDDSFHICEDCEDLFCRDCSSVCSLCGVISCGDCCRVSCCENCQGSFCEDCCSVLYCDDCGSCSCDKCRLVESCDTCEQCFCAECSHLHTCNECRENHCEDDCILGRICDMCQLYLCNTCAPHDLPSETFFGCDQCEVDVCNDCICAHFLLLHLDQKFFEEWALDDHSEQYDIASCSRKLLLYILASSLSST